MTLSLVVEVFAPRFSGQLLCIGCIVCKQGQPLCVNCVVITEEALQNICVCQFVYLSFEKQLKIVA